jgi:hypothetical protein
LKCFISILSALVLGILLGAFGYSQKGPTNEDGQFSFLKESAFNLPNGTALSIEGFKNSGSIVLFSDSSIISIGKLGDSNSGQLNELVSIFEAEGYSAISLCPNIIKFDLLDTVLYLNDSYSISASSNMTDHIEDYVCRS